MMRHPSPRFSVVICNYNYAAYVCEAVRSALDQEGMQDEVEVIVVDDGSTDMSRKALAGLGHEPRLTVVLQENRGQTSAFQEGVERARGEFICFLDSDDLFLPDKLARVARHIDASGVGPDELLLCHDIHIDDTLRGERLPKGWFETMGIHQLGDSLDPAQNNLAFPFSIPCGLIMGRELARYCLQAMPSWDFRRGADSPLSMAAMLKAWRVLYLHEALAVYRVHGANEVARVVDGRYTVGIRLNQRIPRLLSFLERFVDELDLPPADRQLRLSCLRWLEHLNRMPSPSRQLTTPRVTVAVIGSGTRRAEQSIKEQSHGGTQLWTSPLGDGTPEGMDDLSLLAQAYRSTQGDGLMFVAPGDRLDRECIERHLFWRQHGALVGLSCSDVRLCTRDGSLVHADVFARSGAWKQALQPVPPLATRLGDWAAPPLAACMFTRSEFLDALFSDLHRMSPALRQAGGWLLVQLTQQTTGLLRMRETLVSVELRDAAAASYGYMSSPASLRGELLAPPVRDAAAWLMDFYQREALLFRRWLPKAWHERFQPWLAAATDDPSTRGS